MLLLLLEAIGLLTTVVLLARRVDWQLESRAGEPSTLATDWVFLGGTGVPVAILALLAAAALALRLDQGWTLAMLAQGLLLFNSLLSYFGRRSNWVFLLMAFGIVMVLYLNSYAVRSALQPESAASQPQVQHEP